VGEKLFAIPWSSLDLRTDAKHFVLAIDKERLKNAEGFDKEHWPNICNERWATTTNKYFGQPPYWDITGDDLKNMDESTGATDNLSARQRWCRPASSWQKASDLIGKDVLNRQNSDIGDVSDIAIDPDTGRMLYAIVSYGGKYVAVPWSALSLSSDVKYFQVDISEQRMKELGFPRDAWPNLASKTWGEQAHSDFKRKPYWDEL
jgi:sporulation protein YlmC with PRC-barrel domain